MSDEVKIVKEFYDANPEFEWNRLNDFTFEFEITKYMMNKYIKPKSKILDIGGGPGRYSLYYASLGHDCTLIDLSDGNVQFAIKKAKGYNLDIKAYASDARDLSSLPLEEYDYIFIMGPMYHLFKEEDRIKVINEAKRYLKKDGLIFVSFIQLFAGITYYLSECPDQIINEFDLGKYFNCIVNNKTWTGTAFTEATFISIDDIVPFMNNCGFEKISLFGQEGITSANDVALRSLQENVRNIWLELSKNLCDKERYLSYSSHIMYIGKLQNH